MTDDEHLEGSPGGDSGSLLICIELNAHEILRLVVKLLSDIGHRIKCIRESYVHVKYRELDDKLTVQINDLVVERKDE